MENKVTYVVLEYEHTQLSGGAQHHQWTNVYMADSRHYHLNDEELEEFFNNMDSDVEVIAEFDTYDDGSHHYYQGDERWH